LLLLVLALAVAAPPTTAEAGVFSALSKLAKLGKAGKAAKIGKLGTGAKLAGTLGGMSFGRRAATVLAGVPGEAGRAVAYVARADDGAIAVAGRHGPTGSAPDLAEAAAQLGARGDAVTLVLDPSVADPLLLRGLDDTRLLVADASGAAHPVRRGDDLTWFVDVAGEGAGAGVDLASFVADQMEEDAAAAGDDDDEDDDSDEDDAIPASTWVFWAAVLAGVVLWRVLRSDDEEPEDP